MEEIWKDVVGYEGRYKISNLGRTYSLITNKILVPKKFSGKNYYYQALTDGKGNVKNYRIHRMVADAFISNPLGLPYINHKDENPSNNCVDNLEWCDMKYNNNYGTKNERMIKTKEVLGLVHKKKINKVKKPVICIETGCVYESTRDAERKTGRTITAEGA